jgi:iron complex transport system ATP-binding protein
VFCHDLTFNVAPGERWVILGPNGAGKTTLLHTLAGLHPALAGSCRVAGIDTALGPRRDVARQLGLVLQTQSDPFPATVLETALIGRHPHLSNWQFEQPDDIQIARDALALFGIAHLAERLAHTLSGGERQRLALATAWTQQPALLLLDEPASHQDIGQQAAVFSALQRQTDKQLSAAICTLHDINLAARYATHVLMLFGNGEHRLGRFDETVDSELLSQLFQHPVVATPGPHGTLWLPA